METDNYKHRAEREGTATKYRTRVAKFLSKCIVSILNHYKSFQCDGNADICDF